MLIGVGRFWGNHASGVFDEIFYDNKWSVGVIENIDELDDSKNSEEFLLKMLKKRVEELQEVNIYNNRQKRVLGLITTNSSTTSRVFNNANNDYVSTERIFELSGLNSSWDFTRLIRLLEELNHNYSSKNFYSCSMLLRAIVDLVPPIFGKSNFKEVANNVGTFSTKKQLLRLNNSLRNIGDSSLHTHIQKKEVLINANQLKFEAELDILLAEIIRKQS